MRYMAGATVLSDAAGDWIEYARLSNAAGLATEDTGDAAAYFDQALDAAIADFNSRERRFGRTSRQVRGLKHA